MYHLDALNTDYQSLQNKFSWKKVLKPNFIKKVHLITHSYQYTREEYIISTVIMKLT